MKHVLIGISFLLGSLNAFSAEVVPTPDEPAPAAVFGEKNVWSANLILGFIQYKEPGVMTESGVMYGVGASLMHPFSRGRAFARAELEYLAGQLKYDGAYMDGTPFQTDTKDYIYSLRALFGSQITNTSVAFYGGLGGRYLNDRASGTGTYEREIRYIYLPFGSEVGAYSSPGLVLRAKAELQLLLNGSVKSHLSQVLSSLPDAENQQSNGIGLRLGLTAVHSLAPSMMLVIEPYLQYWDIGESDYAEIGGGLSVKEPKNNSTFFGLTAGLLF